MADLIREGDFENLPAETDHAWISLQKTARLRLEQERKSDGSLSPNAVTNYIGVVEELAGTFGVDNVVAIGGQINAIFEDFERKVNRAKVRVWANSKPSHEIARAIVSKDAKKAIVEYLGLIELQIESLEIKDRRKKAARASLAEFLSEINEDKVRIGVALTKLAQVASVIIVANAGINEGLDTYLKIQAILGAAQADLCEPDLALIEEEETLLLAPPVKQIEGY